MRILYIGSVNFSKHCLKVVLKNGGNIVGIVTSFKTNNSDHCDLTNIANKHNLPIHYSNNVNDSQTIEWIKKLHPDIIFCWGFSQLIKSELLSIAPKGIIGVHPTFLPKNRGRHPLIWSLVLDIRETALTFFRIDEGIDSGDILSQKKFRISKEDDAKTLYSKIKTIASKQIPQFLPELISGSANFIKQDHKLANYWRKRSQKDGIIDWRMNATPILNLIRALTRPYPGAETNYNNQRIIIWKAKKYNKQVDKNIEPGKIINIINNRPVIKCYDGAIIIVEYEPQINLKFSDYLQ